MAEFFETLLDEFLEVDFLRMVQKKFHYGEEQFKALTAVAGEMLPLMQEEAFWTKGKMKNSPERQGQSALVYEYVVMSLGKGLDELQERYTERGLLLESYMLETLASELLRKGYAAYNRYVEADGTWHVARYHFLGSEDDFPLEMLADLLKCLTDRVSCNRYFYMEPKKSVAFVAELTQDQTVQCEGICVGCGRNDCPNRMQEDSHRKYLDRFSLDMPLNYGYSRIFGRL